MEPYELLNGEALQTENVCTFCNKPLNVSPIFCLETDCGIQEVCGRCKNMVNNYNKRKKWRQNLYEKVGKFLTFPCSYKQFGCKVVLSWDDVENHEKICVFQGIQCPLSHRTIFPEQTCTWEGSAKEFENHVEKNHQSHIINPPQVERLDFKENQLLFTKVGTQIITIAILYKRENAYNCLLMANGSDLESQCYRYQVELFDEEKNSSVVLRKPRLETLSSMIENIDIPDKMLEVDVVKVKEMLNTEYVFGRFGIVRKSKKDIISITGDKNHELLNIHVKKPEPKIKEEVDEKFLQELECPVCNDYMVPPIFICNTGHSVCSVCIKKLEVCPNCRDNFTGSRNFTLEKLTSSVNYPCRNRNQGCDFVTTSNKIMSHELACELSQIKCLLCCEWKGLRSEMYNHLKASHEEVICEPDTMNICDIDAGTEISYFLQAHGELFRFTIDQDNRRHLRWFNVQQVGYSEDNTGFRFQLQFIDATPTGLNLSFTNVCKWLTDLATAHSGGICLHDSLVAPFIFEWRYFYYKIVITKI